LIAANAIEECPSGHCRGGMSVHWRRISYYCRANIRLCTQDAVLFKRTENRLVGDMGALQAPSFIIGQGYTGKLLLR